MRRDFYCQLLFASFSFTSALAGWYLIKGKSEIASFLDSPLTVAHTACPICEISCSGFFSSVPPPLEGVHSARLTFVPLRHPETTNAGSQLTPSYRPVHEDRYDEANTQNFFKIWSLRINKIRIFHKLLLTGCNTFSFLSIILQINWEYYQKSKNIRF